MPNRTAVLPATGHTQWDQLTEWWLSRFKPSTQETWTIFARRWTACCLEQSIDPMKARRIDVETWLQQVDACGYARSTTAGHYDAIASLYKFAFDEELIDRDPCARIPRPKVHRELQHREVLTVLEYAAFLATARTLGPAEHAIAVLGGMMGLRASEMASLQVESLTVVRGYSTLTFIGKGDKAARVPVPIPALGAIHAVVDERTTGPLLRTRSGRGMDRRDVYRHVVRTARAAGITRPISPHALRRTAGTVAIAQGIPIRETQRLLRHSRPETTLQSYDLTGDGIERHASHQVAGFLAGFAG